MSSTSPRPREGTIPEVAPSLLAGAAPPDLWDALGTQITAAGFSLHRGDCGGANGVTDFFSRTVTVRSGVSEAQALKTLAHELGHVLLHDTLEHRGARDRNEVEAESVAYLVCEHLGISADDYSFPYIAGGQVATSSLSAPVPSEPSLVPVGSSLSSAPLRRSALPRRTILCDRTSGAKVVGRLGKPPQRPPHGDAAAPHSW